MLRSTIAGIGHQGPHLFIALNFILPLLPRLLQKTRINQHLPTGQRQTLSNNQSFVVGSVRSCSSGERWVVRIYALGGANREHAMHSWDDVTHVAYLELVFDYLVGKKVKDEPISDEAVMTLSSFFMMVRS